MNKFSDKKRKHVRHCEALSAEAIQKNNTTGLLRTLAMTGTCSNEIRLM